MKRFLAVIGLALIATAPAAAQTEKQTWKEKRAEKKAAGYPNVDEWRDAWKQLSPDDRATLAQARMGVVDYSQNLTPSRRRTSGTAPARWPRS
jgi:hypothetical protein